MLSEESSTSSSRARADQQGRNRRGKDKDQSGQPTARGSTTTRTHHQHVEADKKTPPKYVDHTIPDHEVDKADEDINSKSSDTPPPPPPPDTDDSEEKTPPEGEEDEEFEDIIPVVTRPASTSTEGAQVVTRPALPSKGGAKRQSGSSSRSDPRKESAVEGGDHYTRGGQAPVENRHATSSTVADSETGKPVKKMKLWLSELDAKMSDADILACLSEALEKVVEEGKKCVCQRPTREGRVPRATETALTRTSCERQFMVLSKTYHGSSYVAIVLNFAFHVQLSTSTLFLGARIANVKRDATDKAWGTALLTIPKSAGTAEVIRGLSRGNSKGIYVEKEQKW